MSQQELLDQLRRLEKSTEQGEVCQAKIREQIAKPEGNQSEHGLRDELKELERSTNEDKARLAKVSKNIADREALRKFREGYEIGNTPPSHLEEKLRQDFASRWPEGKLLEHDVPKARLLCEWTQYWRQFGARYVTKITEENAAKATLSKTRELSGTEGAIERTKLRYIRFTQAFVQFLRKREVTADLIKEFPHLEGVHLKKGRDFLGVLLSWFSVKWKTALRPLKNRRIGLG